MLDVLNTTEKIALTSKDIKIHKDKILMIFQDIKFTDLDVNDNDFWAFEWSLKEQISIIIIFNTVNFCFWAENTKDKWTVFDTGEKLDGSIGIFRCLENAIKNDKSLLDPRRLMNLNRAELSEILKGNIEIPLFIERLNNLNELGKVLIDKFKGSFEYFFNKANHDSNNLVRLLVDNFPQFNDISFFENNKIAFYKRAQLNSKMISDTLVFNGAEPLENLSLLTAFADYKVPQILRKLGVLEYSDNLSSLIDNYKLIDKDSVLELEIRSCTIWAVEYIKDVLSFKYPHVNAAQVDHMLWKLSQNKSIEEKPYHRTYTTAY